MSVVLRWGLLALGVLFAAVAWREWTYGTPPVWSLAAARAEAVVARTELVERTRANGHHVQVPHVYVEWPPGGGGVEEVAGLRSSHEVWHMHTPAEYVRDHPVGSAMIVRVLDGHPVADRTDLRDLGYAVAASLLALMLTAGGLALFSRGHAGREAAE